MNMADYVNSTNCTDCIEEFSCENITEIIEYFKYDMNNESLIQKLNYCNYLSYPEPLHLAISVPYALIFLLSVMGNSLVILTLIRHKKMRTITNVYLLNLALSDLLLAVFCMPFTLIPILLRDFIFGDVICVMIRYLQSVSVCVSCYTLVAISIERYYAICQPLRSRRWQTLYHSYRVLVFIWILSLFITIPIAVFTKRMQIRSGAYACREIWLEYPPLEKLYTAFLDFMLLVTPLFIMGYSYGRIGHQLWKDVVQYESFHSASEQEQLSQLRQEKSNARVQPSPTVQPSQPSPTTTPDDGNGCCDIMNPLLLNGTPQNLRQVNYHRVLLSKKRVIKMLCVVVLEYFVCWTPIFIINTWAVMDYMSLHTSVSMLTKALLFLLAYLSSCIHPITYCFMNRRFRQSFVTAVRCCSSDADIGGRSLGLVSETSQSRNARKTATSTAQTSLRVVFQKKPSN